jgi:WD40 repeat protein
VQIYEVGEHHGLPYFSMEYVDGGTLAQRLDGTPWPPVRAAFLVETIARAVHAAHERDIVHRDLKPGNILLQKQLTAEHAESAEKDKKDNKDCKLPFGHVFFSSSAVSAHSAVNLLPKIADFGLAKRLTDAAGATSTGAVLGTPSYMAPEQAKGSSRDIGPATDVYALGAILYELLTGRPPFKAASPAETLIQVQCDEPVPPARLQPTLPRDLETVCTKCLHKEAARRYPSALALADDLGRFLRGEPVRARPVGRAERTWRWCRRNLVVAGLTALVTISLLAGTAFSTYFAVLSARNQHIAEEEAAQKTAYALQAKANAQDAREQAAHAKTIARKAQLASARSALARGCDLCEAGEVRQGLLCLASGLKEAPEDAKELQHVLRANLSAWLSTAPRLRAVAQFSGITSRRASAVSPDGRAILAGMQKPQSGTVEIRAWDTITGQTTGLLIPQEHMPSAVAFSPNGQTFWVGNNEGSVRGYDSVTGNPLGKSLAHVGDIRDLKCSPDGKLLVTACTDGKAQLWTIPDLQPVGTPLCHGATITCAAFSPDGRHLTTGGMDRTVRIWETATGKLLDPPLTHASAVLSIAFSPDGHRIATGSQDGVVRLWDAVTHADTGISSVRHGNEVTALAFSPDSKILLSGSWDCTARRWDPSSGNPIGEPMRCGDTVLDVAFCSDQGAFVAAVPWSARVWQIPSVPPVLRHNNWVATVAISPDSKTVLTGTANLNLLGPNGEAVLWDAATGRRLGPPLPHRRMVLSAAFSPDGRRFLTGSGHPKLPMSGEACLWDTGSRTPVGPPLDHPLSVYGVAFHPDGRTFATASGDGRIRIWDVETRKLLRVVPADPSAASALVACLAYRPDGNRLVTGSEDDVARQWDTSTWQRVGPELKVGAIVAGIQYSPDGTLILTGGGTHTGQLWDADTGRPTGRQFSHGDWMRSVAFSPDGRMVLTASGDKTARLWDAATGKPIGPTLHHQDWVPGAAFSSDGRMVVTGSKDNTARMWQVAPPIPGDPERVRLWVESWTGQALDEDGNAQPLIADAWQERQRQLVQLGGPPSP